MSLVSGQADPIKELELVLDDVATTALLAVNAILCETHRHSECKTELTCAMSDIELSSGTVLHILQKAVDKIPQTAYKQAYRATALAESLHVMQTCTNSMHRASTTPPYPPLERPLHLFQQCANDIHLIISK